MTPESVKNLIWANQDKTAFDCVVKFSELDVEVPFTCSLTDNYEHTQLLWANGLAGEYGDIAEYVLPPVVDGKATRPQPVSQGVQTL